MAERPVFMPSAKPGRLVEELSVTFTWHKGMAPSQKRKNVEELHLAALKRGVAPLLEVSTKSERLGRRLSAFNLLIDLRDGARVSLESAYQGSKVFSHGGPFSDLFGADSRLAKQDQRLTSSGTLQGFVFEGMSFPLFPKTAFYDWLYLRAVFKHREFLQRLHAYAGFTDIEFNPERSINCQARSCATFVSLDRLGLLESCVSSSSEFINVLAPDSEEQPHSYSERQGSLFG